MSVTILVLTAVAAAAVLIGVALTVMGKGGQLARFEADHPPLDLPDDRPITGTDVSRVALPLSAWGYHVRAVDELLRRVVGALAERDATIRDLEQRLAVLDPERGRGGAGDIDDVDGLVERAETDRSLSAAPDASGPEADTALVEGAAPGFAADNDPDGVHASGLRGDHDDDAYGGDSSGPGTGHEQWALHGGSEVAGGAAKASDPA
ncbi:hypothetical protein ACFOVU_14660 [Nocardiopsis sediminis]|uniref:DivIVA domain-containing protein n=1 Tax=Nocardiopsis sediminis TaxID=1778267 RepID=A0ABV8FMV6_9ACTN